MALSLKLKSCAVFSLLNLPLSWMISWRYLGTAELASVTEVLYVLLVLLGHIGFLLLLLFVPLILTASVLPARIAALLAITGAGALQLFLLVDTFIYDLYRFHFSGFVLDMLINAGSDVFRFSLTTWLQAGAAVLGMLLLQTALWWLAQRILSWKSYAVTLGITFTAMLSVHLWHAWADANYRTDVTSYTRHFPFYYPVTAKRLMADLGLTDPQALRKNMELKSGSRGQGLNYPASEVRCVAPQSVQNVLVLLVDSLRHDMLTEEIMPNLYRFAQQPNSFSLSEHFSGGNSTKAGVFSLFYGVPVSYWDAFTAAQKPPVLMDRLQALGYHFEILSSATLVSPAFDRNIFAGLKDVPLYTAGGVPWERDRTITDKWKAWVAQREDTAPFFGFLFYDAVHGYSMPDGFPRIEPFWDSVNHLQLSKDFDREPYFNRYKTSARYVDSLLGEVLAQLQETGVLDSTVVIVTSDHGESFNEYGRNFWGHGSNYTKEQVQVPLVVHWPGEAKTPAERRTAHADIPVTLMEELLGCSSADDAYSLGRSLLKARDKDWIISGSYLGEAVLLPEHYVDIQLSGQYQVYGYDMTPAPEVTLPPATAADVLNAMSRFYRWGSTPFSRTHLKEA